MDLLDTPFRLKPMIEPARLGKDHLPGLLARTKLSISKGVLEAIYPCCADLPLNFS